MAPQARWLQLRHTGPVLAVVSGVSGSGKSTVGAAIAAELGWDFAEGDDFHPACNVAKMSSGIPLTDADRLPWLGSVRDWLASEATAGHSALAACSALRRSYRDVLREAGADVRFICLTASEELLRDRMTAREGHFMPASLLASQEAIFEPLAADEPGWAFDAAQPAAILVARAVAALRP